MDKQLGKIPQQVARKFYAWVTAVQLAGLRQVRMRPGFHDEPLKENRIGQRSVRLNQSYRAIYIERTESGKEWIEVLEVNNHEY